MAFVIEGIANPKTITKESLIAAIVSGGVTVSDPLDIMSLCEDFELTRQGCMGWDNYKSHLYICQDPKVKSGLVSPSIQCSFIETVDRVEIILSAVNSMSDMLLKMRERTKDGDITIIASAK